jgi:hypothetical protein
MWYMQPWECTQTAGMWDIMPLKDKLTSKIYTGIQTMDASQRVLTKGAPGPSAT